MMSAPAEPRRHTAWLFFVIMAVVSTVVFAVVAVHVGGIAAIFAATLVFACGAFPFVLWDRPRS